ncbi:MAG: phosphoribosylamine--glycine ligase [Anaerofustis stercorihominis]|nr:phosphoribosylamine--glycine ligase [Anaerofustis stercorihominis]
MNILVVGSGGREHALIEKIRESELCEKIYCAPGNAGIAQVAECLDIQPTDIEALCNFAKEKQIGLTVIGPEAPLVEGIVDKFESEGLKAFGPSKDAARFEGSKAYTKKFLQKHNIPTAQYKEVHTFEEAVSYLDKFTYPLVVKADGLAAGKGVFICPTKDDAYKALDDVMNKKTLGDSGDVVVLEEYLDGVETSALCFVDGQTLIPMTSSKDYKRIFDNDMGDNTGGMGTYSPNPLVDEAMAEKIEKTVLAPIMKGFLDDGIVYKGVLYVGLMICDGVPKVLEFNVRFGDPETQVLMLRLETDLVKIMLSCCDGFLSRQEVKWKEGCAVCVVMASGGYPASSEKGVVINGLDSVFDENIKILHAATKIVDGKFATNGGRVLNICALSDTIENARQSAYKAVEKITFDRMQYRSDIAKLDK